MITINIEELASALADRLQQPTHHWMTVAEAAEHIRVGETWLRARLAEIPHVRVDGKILLDRHALDAWLLTNRPKG